MSAIHTERLCKRYGDALAVDALDLDVRAGEVYGYQLFGALLGAPRWLVDATPFAHLGAVPAAGFRPAPAARDGGGRAAGLAGGGRAV